MEITNRKGSKMSSYGDCIYCRGEVLERLERIDYRYHGQLFIIENVPVGICSQCGEKFFTSEVAKKLEKTAANGNGSLKTVAIPVISIAA